MEKVYLLLRNNLQSGPYSIGELKQQNLQSTDLIWIEGERSAWCYPSEVEELQTERNNPSKAINTTVTAAMPAAVVPMPVAASKKLTPADEIEMQAEALRKRALSYTPFKPWQHYKAKTGKDEGAVFYRTEEDRIDIVFHRRERNFVPAQLVAAALLTALAVMVWNQRGSLIPLRQAVEGVAAKAATFETFQPAPKPAATQNVMAMTGAAVAEETKAMPVSQTVHQQAATVKTSFQNQPPEVVTVATPAVQIEQAAMQPAKEEITAAPELANPTA